MQDAVVASKWNPQLKIWLQEERQGFGLGAWSEQPAFCQDLRVALENSTVAAVNELAACSMCLLHISHKMNQNDGLLAICNVKLHRTLQGLLFMLCHVAF